jgi:DNA-binding IclR family transcriptional regulator
LSVVPLKNPPCTTHDYLETLTRNGLVATAAELRSFAELL